MKTYEDEVRKRYFWKLLSAINAIISSTKYFLVVGLFLFFIACAGPNITFVPYFSGSTISALPNQNPAYSKDKQSLSIDELKQTEWWTTVQKNLREKEYDITHQKKANLRGGKPAYQAANRAQNLRTYFSENGVNIQPRIEANPSWQTSISLENVGRGKQVVKLPKIASSRIDGFRIEFQRGSVCEWYENSPKGIEQGFKVLEKPNGTGMLVLGLLTKGTTRPVLFNKGNAIDFVTTSNRKVLKYSDLHVFDTNGQPLLSRFEVNNQCLNIIIDDSSAAYPITVDPLFTSPVWTWENNATSVSTAGDVNGDGYSDVIVGDLSSGDGGSAFVFYGSENGLSTSPDWEVGADVADAWFGYSVATAGDVNGDGYSDVIIGALNYSNGSSWEGAAFVYYESSSGLSLTPDWSAESNEQGAYLGWSVGTAGDVNGDGYSDVIIGAPQSEYHSRRTGNAYVFHGSASGLGANGTPANADWTAEGDQVNAFFGDSVATAGDVNGDGYSDIIIGAPYYDDTQSNEGKVFAYYGSGTGLGASGTPSNADWAEDGYDITNLYFGDSVSTAGDVNGDGYSDVVIGGPGYNVNRGIASVYLGSSGGISTFHRYYYGVQELDQIGKSVGTAGDINGDGFADIIVGSAQSNAIHVIKGSGNGLPSTGQIPLRASWSQNQSSSFGGSVGTAGDIDGDGLSDIIVGGNLAYVYFGSFPGIESTPSQTIDGEELYRYFSRVMNSAGDINADGYMDVIVGDRGYGLSEGIAYVYYGSADGVNTTTPDWEVTGGEQSAYLGYSVSSAGDVNGDGYGDIIIGAPGYGDYGAAFVYYGSASGVSTGPDIVVGDENQGEVCFGEVVAPAGDVNGDGYDDVIVSAPIYNVTPGGREGAAFLYLGSSQGLVETPVWDVFGGDGSYRYGTAIGTAGDVNGDGYGDFFVTGMLNAIQGIYVYYGAPQGPSEIASWAAEDIIYSANTAGDVNDDGFFDIVIGDYSYSGNTGRVAVFHGSPSGLGLNGTRPVGNFTNADWSINGSTVDSYFGISVSTAGDANRDGYSDIIVGEPYSYSTASSGKAYIFYASASGITSVDPWSYECSQADNNADFGQPVISAGDINGDGFSDILIGANEYTDTFTNEGRIFFFYGNDGGGSSMPLPTQFETDGVTEIDKMGTSDSETAFVFSVRGRTPFGRGDVRVEWEAKPAGQPFDGTGTFTSTGWQDSGIAGHIFTEQVTGLVGHTPYKWRVRFLYKADNPMGLRAGGWHVPFADGHYYLKTNNMPPIGGYNSDNVIPTDQGQIIQSTEENESGVMTIYFRIKDAGINDCTLHAFQYSVNGGQTWETPANGDASGSLGGGWPDNDGTLYSSVTDWTGTVHSFTLNTKHSDVQADFNNIDQSDVRIRFIVNDGLEDSALPVTANTFRVDCAAPTSGAILINDDGGTTNDATPVLSLDSTGTNYMRFALSEGGLSSASWVPYANSYSAFNISSGGNGTKTIWVEFRDEFWNIQTSHASDTTIYDTSPVVSGDATTNNTSPTWTWTSNGGTGTFRYKLDDDNLDVGATPTTNLFYTPSSPLSEGFHTLYVQEMSSGGFWSWSGSFTIEVDSGKPCSEAASPAAVDDQSKTFDVTYSDDDIYAGETCGSASSGSGLAKVDLYVKAPGESGYTLVDTDPEGYINGIFQYNATDEGAYRFYTLATDKAGNVEDVPSEGYDTETIYASQFSGYAILAVGSISGEEGLEAHTLTANNIYTHLINRNFTLMDDPLDPLDHIKYFNPYEGAVITGKDDYTINPDDPQGPPIGYKLAMEKAITQWTLEKMNVLPGPLFIILVDHGTYDAFSLTATDYFTSQELDTWLDSLESDMAAQGIDQPIVVVLGTCYSGSFIDDLSKSGRIIVTSTAYDEPSYRGPETPTGVRDGEFFISALFNEWGKGIDLKTSFERAVGQTEAHTDSGTTNSPAPYFDTAMQHPYLDDDGQSPWGSHDLAPGGDGDVADTLFLGYGTAAADPVFITEVGKEPVTPLGPTETQATLWAKVSDSLSTDSVWVEIREPDVTLEAGTEQQVVDLIEVDLIQAGDRYESLYTEFNKSGRYTLFFYAKDNSGIISPFVTTYLYKEIAENQPPGAFSLLSPDNGSSTTTTAGLGAAWEESVDPDGGYVTYTLEIFTDPGGTLFYKREGITETICVVGSEANFVDGQSYIWKVTAVDQYGTETPSNEIWGFSIDNNNPLAGWIEGLVYDVTTYQPIPHAQVEASGVAIALTGTGYYLGTGPTGTFTFTISATGYATSIVSDVGVPEGDVTTMDFGLVPSGASDSDGDGVLDSQDNCPNIANPNQEDADEDGVGDVCDGCPNDPDKTELGVCGCGIPDTDSDGDLTPDCNDPFPTDPNEWLDTDGDLIGNNADPDDDNDDMPDTWEIQYGLNPLIDDASGDLDGDGVSNLDEYLAGTDPTNAAPETPVLSSPDNGQSNVSLTPELQTGAFSDPDGDTHAETTWQISTESDFSSLVLDVTSDSLLTSLTVPEFIVTVNTTYYWRAKFSDDRGAASEWSDPYWFTTIDASASDDTDSNGIPDNQEVDNTVDLDGDGNPDYNQSDMKSVNTVVGDGQIGIKEGTNITSVDSIKSIDPDDISDTTNKPDEMPLGIITFKVTVDNPGDTAEVVVYLSEPAPSDPKWYKYDTIHGWREYPYATFNSDGTVTLALKDGDYGDCDGTANRIIVDPSGFGVAVPPTVTTGSATSVTSSSATLNGTVNPNGLSTTYYFDYGTTTSYGSTTASANAGSGTSDFLVSADVTGLSANTTYHIRIVATNSLGTSYGSDQSFTTVTDAGGGGGGGGGGCFIATAAYGSPMESHVKILRDFRDRFMLTNPVGEVVVDIYYNYSPPVADFIAGHDTMRLMVRWSLLPLVVVSWMALYFGPWVILGLMLLLLSLMCATVVVALKSVWQRERSFSNE